MQTRLHSSGVSLSQIIEQNWKHIISNERYNSYLLRHLYAIKSCRTEALGGELYVCDDCGRYHKRYYSCRNRNCPTCQRTQAYRWIEDRNSELLPTTYFHCVFTVPDAINEWFVTHPRQMYKILFDASWYTLDTLGWDHKYLGAQIGGIAVLHSWGQNLSLHPHIHFIVPGGGIDLRGKWRETKSKGRFLFPVKVMSIIFRARFMKLWTEWITISSKHLDASCKQSLVSKDWVVFSKQPFGGAAGALEYIGRYVFKTAISNHRIISSQNGKVSFRYKDYRQASKVKTMTLDAEEFIRRFSMHILPKGFVRVRHYGILSGRVKRKLFDIPMPVKKKDYQSFWMEKGLDILQCPNCKKGRLIFIHEMPKRGPPHHANYKYKKN